MAVSALTALVLTAGAVSPTSAAGFTNNPNPDTLRVLTYNVCMNTRCAGTYGLAGTEDRLRQIQEWVVNRDGQSRRPDVLVLQEANYKEVSTGTAGDGEKLEAIFEEYKIASKQDERWILYNTATLSVTDSGTVGVGEPDAASKVFPWAQFARKGTNNRATVVDVHLANGDAERQGRELDRLAAGLGAALPLGTRTVVAGDFNARRTDATAAHVNDAFASRTGPLTDAVPAGRRTSTLHAKTFTTAYSPVWYGEPEGAGNLPIDHVYFGSGLHCVPGAGQVYMDRGEPRVVTSQAEEDARWAEVHARRSDHNAVYTELSWTAGGGGGAGGGCEVS
ncbi:MULTISPECIES: endonuclease/exonuclease/phosphatase family protein [unclassified Streptomyces]|uniref:endonuclease/exonuclease/phosphatase family protein n=1 Tax=unclassified Streptomyces TaxID=2593676 RepID=UPI000BACDC75|nr:endonuclease/exonuclease/phosphatase family protein [Streptomyces sp. CLI2509]ASY33627.1 hypothetical protein CAC01_13870 [Streptomyces sp. CLI2509]MYX24849.1 hypothetical protein [Streptomyces sp. SID8380]